MKRPRPRKVIVTVLVFLLLGAIVNIAVAWGFAARRARLVIDQDEQGAFLIWNRPWMVAQHRGLGMIDVGWMDISMSGMTPQWMVDMQQADIRVRQESGRPMRAGRLVKQLPEVPQWGTLQGPPLPDHIKLGNDIACGWPLTFLWMQTTSDLVGGRATNLQVHGGWMVRGQQGSRHNDFIALPYWIIWPGFAINTVFYAAILWLLFALPFALRRWRRIKRGLCPACAYPVGASDLCTECGSLLPGARSVTTPY